MASARLSLPVAIVLLPFCWTMPGFSAAQNPPTPEQEPEQTAETEGADEDAGNGGRRGRRNRDGIKPYGDVVTDEAESDAGVFTVHRLDDKVFYEIPEAELGKEFLWVSQIARTTRGRGLRRSGARQPSREVGAARRQSATQECVVRDRGRHATSPIARAVEAANNDSRS